MKQTDSGIWVPDTPTIFVKPTEEIISQRKMEGMQKLSEIKQWGLRNPTKFMERFIGVDLLDVQTYTFMNSWDKMYALWLCTRNYGKSTLLALYYMTRGMLLNNCRCYICAGTSDQSIETFEKIVSIAKNEIESFTGLTDVFRNEVVINMTNNDGFIRNPAGFTYRLYNGSFVKTLNSNVNAKRGKRAEAVCFDESGFLDEEVFQVIEPYTAQDKNFKMGGSVNVTTLPKELPNQLLYTSSASTTDSYFYKKYKEYSKAMIWGSKDHFVADINCEIMFNATYRGKIYPASLLTKEKVDNAMRENKEKALREYYNIFTSDGGADAIFKRSMIVKNSTIRPPIMFNDTKDRLFALAYDPARSMDNSFVLVGEYYKDSSDNWRMRIANGINFMDLSKKNKTPMRTPEQVKKLKQLILDYNGDGVDDYTNISNIFIDAGSGGAGVNIADYLMEKYKGLVRKKARAMFLIGGDTDDLIQEGMIGLFKAVRDYQPDRESSFQFFANICIDRQIYTAIKSSNRQKHQPLNTYVSLSDGEAEENFRDSCVEHDNPESILIDRENVAALENEMKKSLSPLENRVLQLYLDGNGYMDIARILGKTPKSIDNALQRIRGKIKSYF